MTPSTGGPATGPRRPVAEPTDAGDGQRGRVHRIDRDPDPRRRGRGPRIATGWWRSAPSARSTCLVAQALAVPARTSWPSVTPSLAARAGRPAPRRASRCWPGPTAWPPSPPWPTWWSTGWWGSPDCTVTLAALEAGSRLALANKESIIAGAPVVARVRETPGAEIIPVDSEHCAVHQCLRSGRPRGRGPPAADRLGRALPGPQGRRARLGRGRRGPGPSDLVDGTEDHASTPPR